MLKNNNNFNEPLYGFYRVLKIWRGYCLIPYLVREAMNPLREQTLIGRGASIMKRYSWLQVSDKPFVLHSNTQ